VKWDRTAGLWRKYLDGLSAYELDFSKHGQWVAYVRYPDHTLWKSKLDGSEPTQLTSPDLEVHQPHWSPDGQQIAFMALVPNGHWRILVLTTSSGAIDQPIPDGPDQGVPTWSADGRFIIYGDRLYTKSQNTMTIHLLDYSSRKVSTMEGSSGLWTPRWSPNGAFISALRQNWKGLLLKHSGASDWREILRGEHIDDPTWSPDSKYIYLMRRLEAQRLQVLRVAVDDGRVEVLADIENFPFTTEHWFGVAPDGSPIGLRGVLMQEIYAIERARP
jgi:Tol biopolymer transport system component